MAIAPVFLPGESHGRKALQVTVQRVIKSQTRPKQLSMHVHVQTCQPAPRLYSKGKPQSCRAVRNHTIPTLVEPIL